MRNRDSILAACVALSVCAAARVNAQRANRPVDASTYSLSGTIADQDGRGIADAEVSLLDAAKVSRRVRSDTAGRFDLGSLSTGVASIHVRRLGFSPRDVEIRIPNDHRHATVVVTLDPMAAELTGMSVTDTAGVFDERLREFDARRATNNFGRYIDGDAIARRRPQFMSEMLRTVPGVTVLPGRIGNLVRIRGCYPLVWVDGVRLPGAQLDDVARPADIAGLEIYSSFAGIPAQYFDRAATCGTVLVWTRAR